MERAYARVSPRCTSNGMRLAALHRQAIGAAVVVKSAG